MQSKPAREKGSKALAYPVPDGRSPSFFMRRDTQSGTRPPFVHSHSGYEFGAVVDGSVLRRYDGKEYLCEPGDVFLIDCTVPHGNRPHKRSSYEKVFVFVHQKTMAHLLPESDDVRLILPFRALHAGATPIIKGAPQIRDILVEAHRAQEAEDPGSRLRAWPMVVSALVEIYLAMRSEIGEVLRDRTNIRNQTIVQRAIDYIVLHRNENVGLTEMAAYCHLSRSRFRSLFSEIMKIPPVEYRNRLRIDDAVEGIIATDQKLTAIADQCGFSSYTQFAALVKRFTGMSPGEIRIRQTHYFSE